ncbi:MAG: hypothetical protein K0S29_1258 [Gammaproteobacteria bacterium]|jgi:hypothetical protein|nr:hypothetical protein [Gammaproteobacteria bacterium]
MPTQSIGTLTCSQLFLGLKAAIMDYVENHKTGGCILYFSREGIMRASRLSDQLAIIAANYQGMHNVAYLSMGLSAVFNPEMAAFNNSPSRKEIYKEMVDRAACRLVDILRDFDWGSSKVLKAKIIECMVELHFNAAEITAEKKALARIKAECRSYTKTERSGIPHDPDYHSVVTLTGEELRAAKEKCYTDLLGSAEFKQDLYLSLYAQVLKTYPVATKLELERLAEVTDLPGFEPELY